VSSLWRRILGLCLRWVALCPPCRSECLLALMLLLCDMAADFLAVL
jgi:hypothetical protein